MVYFFLFAILQTPPTFNNYEDLGVKSISISLNVILIIGIWLLYKSKENAIKEKDEKIFDIIKEHQEDLKELGNDYKGIFEKHLHIIQELKNIVGYGKRP